MVAPVAVFGGGGFIGTNLCRFLSSKGVPVRAMSRSWLDDSSRGVKRYTGDITDVNLVREVVGDAQFVFHLAHGYTPASSMDRLGAELLGAALPTLELMKICAQAEAKLIFVSSGGTVYGPEVEFPTKEDSPCEPITGYGVCKLALEKYLNVFDRHYGLDYRILRLSNPYGPWQLGRHGQGVIGAWLERALKKQEIEIWGDGSVVRDYIYIDDVVAAMWAAAIHQGSERIFNIGSGRGHSLNEIFDLLAGLTGSLIEKSYRRGRASDVPVSVLDVSRASECLGWTPQVNLQHGLELSLEWMRMFKAPQQDEIQ